VRFTSKMLPHLQRGELVEHDLLDPKVAAAAFEELTHAVNVSPIEHLLEPGDLLVFDQYRWAHSRAPLGGGQAELAPASRRLLKQAYVRPEVR
jgi:hypothetical protein